MSEELCPQWPLLTRQQWLDQRDRSYTTFTRYDRLLSTCYPIITIEMLDRLVLELLNDQVLEVGAGSGYLARLLHDRGIDIRAIDSRRGPNTRFPWWENPQYFNVEQIDVNDLDISTYGTILMTWPCMSDFALQVAQKMAKRQFLIYHGEPRGGCCANKEFFDYLSSNFQVLDVEELDDLSIPDPINLFEGWSAFIKIQ